MEEDLADVGSSFPGRVTVKKADLSKPECVPMSLLCLVVGMISCLSSCLDFPKIDGL